MSNVLIGPAICNILCNVKITTSPKQFTSALNFTFEESIMLRPKQEVMCPFLTFLLMLAMTPFLMEGVLVQQKYKLMFSKCELTAAVTMTSAPSLISCSDLCTKSAVYKSFAWRSGMCGLLPICSQSCNATEGREEGWKVYCPNGKVHL